MKYTSWKGKANGREIFHVFHWKTSCEKLPLENFLWKTYLRVQIGNGVYVSNGRNLFQIGTIGWVRLVGSLKVYQVLWGGYD